MVNFLRQLVLAVLCVALATSLVRADGKFFSKAIGAPPTIPDQQAMIVWDPATRTQTLVIDTAVNAKGTELAWVVPVPGPSAPEISEATTGLFPTLRQVFAPTVIHRVDDTIVLVIFALTLLIVFMAVRDLERRYARAGPKARRIRGLLLLAYGLTTLTCISGLLPALGTARSTLSHESIVQVLSRTRLSSTEVTVVGAGASDTDAAAPPSALRSIDARTDAVLSWLQTGGYAVDPASKPVIRTYVEKNWVFICSKVLRDPATPSGAAGPLPLSLRFKTERPVYPMALTAVGNTPIALDLYVYGPGTATAPNMTVERCGPVVRESVSPQHSRWRLARLTATHPEIASRVGTQSTATRLHARLPPPDQASDITIEFEPEQIIGATAYTKKVIRSKAVTAGLVAVLAAGFIWALVAILTGRSFYGALRLPAGILGLVVVLVVAIVAGAVQHWRLPLGHVGISRHDKVRIAEPSDHEDLALRLQQTVRSDMSGPELLAALRASAAGLWQKTDRIRTPIHQDSPTNYIIRGNHATGAPEYVYFDVDGNANVVNLSGSP